MRAFGALLLLLLPLGSACRHEAKEAPPPPRPVQVQAVAAPVRDDRVRYSANIAADTQVALAFKTGGTVLAVAQSRGPDGRLRALQEGDAVRRGTVLARLDPADARQRLRQAEAQLAEAEAGLTKARADSGRAIRLFAADSLTRPDLDAATAAASAAEARAAAARASVALARNGVRNNELRAPLDGVVVDRKVEAGTLAVPGTFAGKVTAVAPAADPQARVFDVEVSIRNDAGRLRPGMIATVEVPLPAGASQAPAAPSVPTVPLTAVVRSDKSPSGYAVFVVEGEGEGAVARARGVTLGEVYGNAIAVAGGVRLGERVVVTGATLLADGERVRVIP